MNINVSEFVNTSFNQLQNKVIDEDYELFTAALGLVFDVDFVLIAHLSNYDYIDLPSITTPCNYAQWLTLEYDERNSISELLSYLFTKSEDVWDEPFEFTDEELKLRREHLLKIKNYGGASAYFKRCSINLWREENYLETNYSYYVKLIDKLILNL